MRSIIRLAFIVLIFASCNSGNREFNNIVLQSGNWKLEFSTQGHQIPISASFNNNTLTVINAEETIEMTVETSNDSFYISIPNFDSHFEGVLVSDKKIKGYYIKDLAEDYSIPFTGYFTREDRFNSASESISQIKSKYKVNIGSGERTSMAIGLFTQNGKHVAGSFATETGDYRFLEGIVDGTKLKMSTFDGSHLYLFTADIKGDSLINGLFISGKTGNYSWVAEYDDSFELRDPEKLTSINNSTKPDLDLKLLSTSGDSVALSDEQFKNKVKIVQIMGTWCPNCLDEARYFNTLFSRYNSRGLEIIAVAFERGPDIVSILKKLNKYKVDNEVEYTMLYGGASGSKNALAVFPYLDKVMSFPTAIYFDKNNNIRKIYTGFYGPGTGEYYANYRASTETFIEELLAE
jgi:thiol-disulfide isomerase/thioredoxin